MGGRIDSGKEKRVKPRSSALSQQSSDEGDACAVVGASLGLEPSFGSTEPSFCILRVDTEEWRRGVGHVLVRVGSVRTPCSDQNRRPSISQYSCAFVGSRLRSRRSSLFLRFLSARI